MLCTVILLNSLMSNNLTDMSEISKNVISILYNIIEFITKFLSLNMDVITRISEVKYDPNNVDNERFLLTMNDGNFVYLTLAYFDKMDSYVSIRLDIISKYGEKKGILYLDSGEYFKILN